MVETTKLKMLVIIALSAVSLLILLGGLRHAYAYYLF